MATPIDLRDDFDSASLRRLAKTTRDATQSRRFLALAAVYDGGSRTDAARIGGVGLQIIRDWVLRFNARGPDGLGFAKISARPRHYAQNELAIEAFKKTSPPSLPRSGRGSPRASR